MLFNPRSQVRLAMLCRKAKWGSRLVTLAAAALLAGGTLTLPALAQSATDLRGHYQKVIQTLDQELATARKNRDRLWEVYLLNEAGDAYLFFGNYQKAADLQQQALAVARAIPDYTREKIVLRELGTTYSKLGDELGINFYRQQLALVQKQGDRQRQIMVLNQLGTAYLTVNRSVEAIDAFNQRLSLVRATQNRQQEAQTLSSLASAYGAFGDRVKQQALLEQVLSIDRELKDWEGEIGVLQLLGSIEATSGNIQSAIQRYQAALDLTQQGGELMQAYQVAILQELAVLNARLNRVAQTINYLEQSQAMARPSTKVSLTQAFTLNYLGRANFLQGKYDQAIEYYTQSLMGFRANHQAASPPTSIEAEVLTSLGQSLFYQGKLTEAETALRQAIAIYEANRQAGLSYANTDYRSRDTLNVGLYESVSDTYRALQQVLVAQHKPAAALEMAEAGRTRAFVELLTSRLGAKVDAESTTAPLNLAQMQQLAKASQSTLVEYSVLYGDLRNARFWFGKQQAQPQQLLIWVVQPTKVTLRQVDLTPLLKQHLSLDTLVTNARQAIGAKGRGLAIAARDTASATNGRIPEFQQLHQLLIQPIADLLPPDPNARLVFVPQDFLFLVPFAALQDASGQYLIEHHTILVAPSIQVLQLTQDLRQRTGRSLDLGSQPAQALVVGNPTMPSLPLKPGMPPEPLPPLPGAEQEAQAIAHLLKTTALIGNQATEAAVVQHMLQAKIVHLATHGLLDNIFGAQSSLALAPTRQSKGLSSQKPDAEDGLLRAREILQLKLNADLVVLSACDTGRGSISGDGVIGLSRAFIGAGVPSVIVSLWSIPDAPTSFLMTQFYQNLQQRLDKAQALRQAMLATLKHYPHPSAWAAFILMGEAE